MYVTCYFLFTIHLYCCRFCLSQAITAMVQKAVDYIDLTLEIGTRIELIKTLSSVSAGKVRIFHLDDFFPFQDSFALCVQSECSHP